MCVSFMCILCVYVSHASVYVCMFCMYATFCAGNEASLLKCAHEYSNESFAVEGTKGVQAESDYCKHIYHDMQVICDA
jgi:hypothetical protein